MLKIADYYTQDLLKLHPSAQIMDVLQAFLQHRIDIACVLNDSDQLVGIISKYALFRALLDGAELDTSIGPYIRCNVITIDVNDSLDHAREYLMQNNVAHGVIIDEQGQVLGAVGKSDIIRGFLHKTELLVNQLSGLIEHLQDVVVSINTQGQIVTFNRSAEKMFDLTKEEVIGQTIDKCFPELSPELRNALILQPPTEPRRLQLGQHIVIASFIPISHPNGTSGAMVVLQDITTLESIAKELESTKNLQHTIHHALTLSYDAIIIIDWQGYITDMNDACIDLFDLGKENLMFQHWSKVIPELSMDAVLAGHAVEGDIRTIRDKPCFVIQEPIVRAGKHLGAITKIIFRQLEEWRDVFRRLEQLESELNYYRGEFHRATKQSNAFDLIISANPQMEKVKQQALLAAENTTTVLITGESGTGKELFAEAIHRESKRDGNFIKVNCAAIPSELLESEFFGYSEGAFTGARKGGKKGKFELADNGTLFLDEIGDMPLSLQAKLLRALQEQTFERVGDIKSYKVNVRIIAATNKDLKKMITQGTFREDLYYRIDVVNLCLPALRERLDDLPLLCDNLIKKLNKKLNKNIIGITPATLSLMQSYSWPGNVRQLENILERAFNMGVKQWIEPQHLPDQLTNIQIEKKDRVREHSIEDMEKQLILETLKNVQSNRTEAARLLGISRSSLYNKMRKYGIHHEVRFHT